MESRKANLTFISGILGFTPARTLSRRISRDRGRLERGGSAGSPRRSFLMGLDLFSFLAVPRNSEKLCPDSLQSRELQSSVKPGRHGKFSCRRRAGNRVNRALSGCSLLLVLNRCSSLINDP